MSKQSTGTSDRKPVLHCGPLMNKPIIRNGESKSSGNIGFSRNTNAGVYDESSDDLSDVTIDSMNDDPKRSRDRLPLAVLNLDDDGVPRRDHSSNSKAQHTHDSSRDVSAATGRKNRFKKLPPIPLSAPYKPVPVENMR